MTQYSDTLELIPADLEIKSTMHNKDYDFGPLSADQMARLIHARKILSDGGFSNIEVNTILRLVLPIWGGELDKSVHDLSVELESSGFAAEEADQLAQIFLESRH